MAELRDGEGRKGHLGERHHLIAHGVRIEFATHGILHPRVGHEDPPGGDRCSQTCEPGGGEVEAWRYLLPAEIHHSHEGRLHEEGHDTLDGQRGAEDVAHKPAVVGPVFNNSAEAIRSDYMDVGALMICHEDLVVELLEKMFEDEYSYITYWLYELNYGRAYKAGCIKEANGKDIDISTAEKLYDFLIKNMKEKNK